MSVLHSVEWTMRRWWLGGTAGAIALMPSPSYAQITDTLLPPPVSPSAFETDENQALRQKEQSDWSALGVRISSFMIRPKLDLLNGVTTNVYQSEGEARSGRFASIGPTIDAVSDWSRHSLRIVGSADFDRYAGEPQRNQDRWNLQATGKLDVSYDFNIQIRADSTQGALSRFSGEIINDNASVAIYRSDSARVNAGLTLGRARVSGALEHYNVRFKPLRLIDGRSIDQSFLDRKIQQSSIQLEYGLSSSVSLFAVGTLNRFDFDDPTNVGYQSVDSSGKRILGGMRVMVAGIANMTVGLGYSSRNYEQSSLKNIGRFSAESKLQIFPSELMTVSFSAGRRLSDARLIDSNPLYSTFYSLRVDHAPRRALAFYASAATDRQNNFASRLRARNRQVQLGGKYLISRNLELVVDAIYSDRNPDLRSTQRSFDEFRSSVTATIKL